MNDDLPDPTTPLDEMAAGIAEQFNAFVKAGIPPAAVAVMLGTMLGTLGNQGLRGSDGS